MVAYETPIVHQPLVTAYTIIVNGRIECTGCTLAEAVAILAALGETATTSALADPARKGRAYV